ncbi:hypothetical protein D5018_19640 [Parashewanella curva]|uniref:Uncharacterized protein n=1 Tax=Parashewanella curva TaxID=2338552 RepID=A0A3L8PRI6_9GAMM|nr:hypothetical protein D5018_19640 [Parashewanella curva]
MKKIILLALTFLSFNSFSNELKTEISLNVKLLECLDTIPYKEINDQDYKFAKSLTLIPVVIDNLTKSEVSPKYKRLFKISSKYCSKEIKNFAAYINRKG